MADVPAAFGKYTLTEKIATGGMAEIYLAKLIGPGGFEKPLVIKQIRPELGQSPQFVELFVAEAKTLVGLTHGNIVPIYELGVVGDTYFIAMEYIDGPTLEALLRALARRGETLSPARAAHVAAELLEGLDYAHRKGVLHRDLSPRNVMVSRDGEIKLVDFGIATALGAEGPDPLRGGPAGSFPYMSPEQVRGDEQDRRSDVFAAGVLLWELLAGETLFARETPEATLEAVRSAEIPPPSSAQPRVPGDLDDLCRRALDRDPDARFDSAGEFLASLKRYLYSQREAETPASLARLVAKVCPPEVTAPAPRSESRGQRGRATGPVTKPMARDGSRVETFATRPALASAGETDDPASPEPPRRRGRATYALVAAGLAALLAAGIGLATRSDARSQSAATSDAAALAQPTAPPPTDASPASPELATSPPPDSESRSKPETGTGSPSPSRSGSGLGSPPPPASRGPPATGTLKVGADPWADVYLRGRRLGRAPGAFEIPAGEHTIEVVFPPAGDGGRRRFEVSVPPDTATSIGIVDFRRD